MKPNGNDRNNGLKYTVVAVCKLTHNVNRLSNKVETTTVHICVCVISFLNYWFFEISTLDSGVCPVLRYMNMM
jgi:hypothetical protein